MRHGREDRAQRHDALYPTACGHVQEQGRVGAPPQLGLDAAKKGSVLDVEMATLDKQSKGIAIHE
jgi:hypothetical protein